MLISNFFSMTLNFLPFFSQCTQIPFDIPGLSSSFTSFKFHHHDINYLNTNSYEIKAALENVRVEELHLELSSAIKSRPNRQTTSTNSNTNYGSTITHGVSSHGLSSGSNVMGVGGGTGGSLGHHHHMGGSGGSSGLANCGTTVPSSSHATVSWAPTPTQQQGTEIDRIMAKIEQARLSIANVCV
jgi:hypothetical protein